MWCLAVKRRWLQVAEFLLPPLAALTLNGCGSAVYAVQSTSATSKLEEAKELGAEEFAPYEYYMAVEQLKKAREEAANADYSDAINYAELSEEHSEKAIRLSRDAHRGAGR
jgi:glucan phosphoethanolaminetransferase (alkaline phosphatase superfamily)